LSSTKKSTTQIGQEREREFLTLVRQSRLSPDLPDIPDPDRHLDAPEGQIRVCGKAFDFYWPPTLLVELDGGQWIKGGGRHNSDTDRWKTNEAIAKGWIVLHYSNTQVRKDPVRVLRQIAEVLNGSDTARRDPTA
jgi:hypothetical protein